MDTNEIRRLLLNLIRKGAIMDVDHSSQPPTCRVSSGALETTWLPFLSVRAGTTREWNPPTRGEQVVLLCPCGDPAQGIVLCGLHSDAFPAPGNSPDTHTRAYPDGAIVEYNHAAHSLTANLPAGATINVTAPGEVNVNTKEARVTADTVTLDADVIVKRSMTVIGAFVFEGGMSGKAGASGGPAAIIAGTVAVSDDVIAGGKSGAHHSHMEQGDGKPVSEPL
jgi:phage baseplate assembly protein V